LESGEILTRISTKKEKIKEYGLKRSMLDKNLGVTYIFILI
jgi:hypothetical protein